MFRKVLVFFLKAFSFFLLFKMYFSLELMLT